MFECVGLPALLAQAVALVGVRGRVVISGVMLEENRLVPLVALGDAANRRAALQASGRSRD